MFHLLKWFSVLLFISIPVLLVSAIWFGELRFIWISIITGLFSVFAGAYADTIAVAKRLEEKHEQSTLF